MACRQACPYNTLRGCVAREVGATCPLSNAASVNANPIGLDEDYEIILVCAVRYACGRRTYMPSIVIRYIAPLLPQLSERTLTVLERDIADAGKFGGYGDEYIDKPLWIEFLECVRAEIGKRRMNR